MGGLDQKTTYRLLGNKIAPPIEHLGLQIKATFDNENAQANIETDDFTFVNDEVAAIQAYIKGGLTGSTPGIFEGPPFSIELSNSLSKYNAFEGFLYDYRFIDGKTSYTDPLKIKAKIRKSEGLNNLDEQLKSLTYGYLESVGHISKGDYEDVKYLVEDDIDYIELAIIFLCIYVLAKEIAEAVKRLAKNIADLVAHIAGGASGTLAAVVWLAAVIIIDLIYVYAMILEILDLINQVIETFISPIRTHKAMTLKTLLKKAVSFKGYSFDTNISDMSKIVLLPSKPQDGEELKVGIPKPSDYGYNCSEMFEVCLKMFNARLAIIDGTVYFRSLNDEWWVKQSTYVKPTTLYETKRYNTEDIYSNFLVNFQTDVSDMWTSRNYAGTMHGVNISPKSIEEKDNVLVSNFYDVDIPYALGNRKNELNTVEKALLVLAGIAEDILSTFGNNTNYTDKIKQRTGMLKVSENIHSVAKLLYWSGGKMPTTHRDKLNAKMLWDNYISERSFVTDNFKRQRAVYENVLIAPFGFDDFLKLIENSYFTTETGETGKFTSLDYDIENDKAVGTYWIQETYTKNLKEKSITIS